VRGFIWVSGSLFSYKIGKRAISIIGGIPVLGKDAMCWKWFLNKDLHRPNRGIFRENDTKPNSFNSLTAM